jgi:hypothetical protein
MTLIEHNAAAGPAECTNLPSVEIVPSGDALLANFLFAQTEALAKGMQDFKEAVKWLAVAQTAYRYTQREMAIRTGVAQSTISQYLKWHKKGCPDEGPFVRRIPKTKSEPNQTDRPTVIDVEGTVIDETKLVENTVINEIKLVNGPEPEPVNLIESIINTTKSAEDLIAYVVKNAATKDVVGEVIEGLTAIFNKPDDDAGDRADDDAGDAKDDVEASAEARKAENAKLDVEGQAAEVEEPGRRSRRRKG